MTKRCLTSCAVLVATLLAFACGGSDGGTTGGIIDDGGGSNLLALGFVPGADAAAPDRVRMTEGAATANLVTIPVQVTDTDGVYAAAFDVVYDPAVADFVQWTQGSVLESGGAAVQYQVQEVRSGRIVIGISRQGGVPGVNVSGTGTLVNLTFRAVNVGNGSAAFESAALLDSSVPPAPLAGIEWFGGTFESINPNPN